VICGFNFLFLENCKVMIYQLFRINNNKRPASCGGIASHGYYRWWASWKVTLKQEALMND
jgi:hypothetical protein